MVGSGFRRIFAVAAACAIALTLVGRTNAADEDPALPRAASDAGNMMIMMCSGTWTRRTPEALEAYASGMKIAYEGHIRGLAKGRDNLAAEIAKTEAEITKLSGTSRDTIVGALADATQTTDEVSWANSKATAASAKSALEANGNFDALIAAERKLRLLREQFTDVQRRIVAYGAVWSGFDACVAEQLVWIGKNPVDTTDQPPPPPPPPGVVPDMTTASGLLEGVWDAQCVYEEDTKFSNDGRFSLQLNGAGAITGTFVDGQPASLSGSIDVKGKLNAAGSMKMGDSVMALTIWGTATRQTDGSITGNGNFTAQENANFKCTGTWAG